MTVEKGIVYRRTFSMKNHIGNLDYVVDYLKTWFPSFEIKINKVTGTISATHPTQPNVEHVISSDEVFSVVTRGSFEIPHIIMHRNREDDTFITINDKEYIIEPFVWCVCEDTQNYRLYFIDVENPDCSKVFDDLASMQQYIGELVGEVLDESMEKWADL